MNQCWRKCLVIGVLIVFHYKSKGQAFNVEWVQSIQGTHQENIKAMAVDVAGNIYLAGYFTGTADLDPGLANHYVYAQGLQDIMIVKLNANGQFIWGKHIGGPQNESVNCMALDTNGNLYLSGFFTGSLDIDPGPGVHSIHTMSPGNQEVFIAKYDSSGNFMLAKSIEGQGYTDSLGIYHQSISTCYDIKIDQHQHLIMTGSFTGTIDADPGTGNTFLSSLFGSSGFVVKMTDQGQLVWAKQIGGTLQQIESYALQHDTNGNVYLCGVFQDTVDFDPGIGVFNLIASGYNQCFVLKLDSLGLFSWALTIGGSSLNDHASGYRIVSDFSGGIFVSGIFKGQLNVSSGNTSTNLTSNGQTDIFFAKLTPNGSLEWIKSIGGPAADYSYSSLCTSSNQFWITGSFKQSIDLDPSSDTLFQYSQSVGSSDIFVACYSMQGNLLSSFSIGGNGNDASNQLCLSSTGSIYLCGYFSSLVDFDPGIGQLVHTAWGGIDAFILKYTGFGIILPVFLVSFNGVSNEYSNELKWEFQSTAMIREVVIQRSNCEGAFISLDTIKYNEPSRKFDTKTFKDEQISKACQCYRLRYQLAYAHWQESNTIKLNAVRNPYSLLIYPNPCIGTINLYSSNELHNHNMTLFDATGKVVKKINNINSHFVQADVMDLSDGQYFIVLESQQNSIRMKQKSQISSILLSK